MHKRRLILALFCVAGWSCALSSLGATSRVPADEKHWAYQPIAHPVVPSPSDPGWAHNDIDRFVLAKLESQGINPVADAPPEVLVRRVYFDLIGLPPTPQQIDEFLHDASSDRYARLVDRLLASPQFGERWGRHWLDVARFGESLTLRGFVLKDAWRYRDYVIDSFNHDQPFDRFMMEQIAGDLMPAQSLDDRRRQLIATSFLMLGNYNLEEQDKKQLEMDVVDEQINTIGAAFLAQTIGCARCHDHKFDPISTRDYYALAGILHSTQDLEHANVSKWLEIPLPMDPKREQLVQQHESAVASLREKISRAKALIAKGGSKGTVLLLSDLTGIVLDDSHAKQVGTWKESASVRSFIGEGYLTDDGDKNETKTLTFQPDLPDTGKYEVRFAYTAAKNRATNVSVTIFSADGEKTVTVNEKLPPPIDGHFVSLGTYTFDKSGQDYVLVTNEGTDGHVTADAVQWVAPDAPSVIGKSHESSGDSGKGQMTASAVKKLEAEMKKLSAEGPFPDTVISVREAKTVADCQINLRGSAHSLGDVVPRGFPQSMAYADEPTIPKDQSGRLQLAQWLADPRNPLPARVMANRVWHWVMGDGIVRTVDNFGTTGEPPSDRELLDFLATRFIDSGWSVKSLIRQILLSHTYQLSDADDAKGQSLDPENRLHWRMNRRRLDAECIRDEMLAISGQLDPRAGGPSYKAGLASDFGFQQTSLQRSVYLPAFRNALPDVFQVFDMADPSVSTGRRNTSTVAPQALFMMNSPFVIDQARHTADRILADHGLTDDAARITFAYRLILGRTPDESETKLAETFLKQSKDTAEGMTQLVHALFASTDFRYEN